MNTKTVGLGLIAFLLISVPVSAMASLLENLTIGNAKALALGNAVTADPPGVDSIHYNPAGLARIKGREGQVNLNAVRLEFDLDFGAYHPDAQAQIDSWGLGVDDPVENSSGSTAVVALKVPFVSGREEWPLPVVTLPSGGAATHIESGNYTIASAAFVPYAAGYIRDDDDPARFMGKELSLTRLTYFSPSIGFKINDHLSVGASIHFSYQGLSAYTDIRVSSIILGVINTALSQLEEGSDCLGDAFTLCGQSVNPFEQSVTLEVDVETGMSVTGVFGALWEPTPWLSWGFVYHTEGMNRMSGTYRMTYSDDWQGIFNTVREELGYIGAFLRLPPAAAVLTGDAKMELKNPAHFATGVSVALLPNWKLNVDAKWTDWSVWEALVIEYDQPQEFLVVASLLAPEYATPTTLAFPRNYSSVWNFAFGVEHQYNNNLVLRLGWEPRKSSIPDHKQGVLLPLGDGDLYSAGLGYKWSADQHIDLAVGMFRANANIPAGTSTNSNSMDVYNNILYNPYSGLDIKTQVSAYFMELNYRFQF